MHFNEKSKIAMRTIVMVVLVLTIPKIFIGTRNSIQHQTWKHNLSSVGKKCASNDFRCRLAAVNVLKTPTLDDSTLRATKRELINQIWQDARDHSLTAEDLRTFGGYAFVYGDSELVEFVAMRYFADKQPTFKATLFHFKQFSQYLGYSYTDLYQYWEEKTVSQAIAQLKGWDDSQELLENWLLSPRQKVTVLDYAVAAPNKTLSNWWYIRRSGRVDQDSKHTDVHWSEQAADSIIARTDDLVDLRELAETANPRQILAMVHRLNSWPNLATENLVSWVNSIPDQSIAYRVLQDQATRRSNGDLVDAYNQLGDTPVKNWIIDILRQRNPSMNEWNEIYLRSKEGSRLMTLAAIGSLRCDQ